MTQPLLRQTLTDQATEALRQGIAAGHWERVLPSEAQLCHELRISRVTLRRSLKQLAQEQRIIFGGHGRKHRISDQTIKPQARQQQGNIIRYLSPIPRHRITVSTQLIQHHLQEHLVAAGYRLEFECHPKIFQRFSARDLEELAAASETAGWVLYLSTREIQEWFARRQMPCVVTGSVHEGVQLANVEFDVRAAGLHAANLFISRGYSHLVFAIPTNMTAGDIATADGIQEAARNAATSIKVTILKFNASPRDFCRQLDTLLLGSSNPTAFLTGWAEHALTVMGYLHQHGLRVPQDAAIIARFGEPFLDYCVPEVARYRMDAERLGKKAAELLIDQLKHGSGKIRSIKIMPDFVPGQTLGGRRV